MTRHSLPDRVSPLNVDTYSEEQRSFVECLLEEWRGTPYMPGQQCKGVATDCVRFVSAVLDEITGVPKTLERLPQDMSFHNPEKARSGLRSFLKKYPSEIVTDGTVQPGDVLIMGPLNGGPGHAAIVGKRGYWHCDSTGVVFAGLRIANHGVYYLKEVRRYTERDLWYDMFKRRAQNGKQKIY
jgi:cell wall-associated NlpC family hydrolase